MREIVLTTDLVVVSYVESLLHSAGIDTAILDRNAAAMPGTVGNVPQRIVVAADNWEQARRILVDAGLEKWIVA